MGDVSSIIKDDKLFAAWNNVYAGEDDVHFILITQDVFSLESGDIEISVESVSPKMFGLWVLWNNAKKPRNG